MSEYAKNIQTIEDMWKKRIELRDGGGRMTEYIVRVDDLEESYYRYTDIKPETVFGHRLREEIVRCRDCENARVQPWNAITRTGLWCVEHDIPIDVDGFCAWGERRE